MSLIFMIGFLSVHCVDSNSNKPFSGDGRVMMFLNAFCNTCFDFDRHPHLPFVSTPV